MTREQLQTLHLTVARTYTVAPSTSEVVAHHCESWSRKLKVFNALNESIHPNFSRIAPNAQHMMGILVRYGGIITGSQLLKLYGLLERTPDDVDCMMTTSNMKRLMKKYPTLKPNNLEYNLEHHTSVFELEDPNFIKTHLFNIYEADQEPPCIYSRNLRHTSVAYCLEKKLAMLQRNPKKDKHFADLRWVLDGVDTKKEGL